MSFSSSLNISFSKYFYFSGGMYVPQTYKSRSEFKIYLEILLHKRFFVFFMMLT